MAMIIRECRAVAEKFAEQTISDAIITVPPYFNQAERRALVETAKIAGVNVLQVRRIMCKRSMSILQLINDNTAAGLNYGMFRRKLFNDSATTVLLYDMGATKTTATVFEFQLVKDKDSRYKEDKHPQMTTLGVG
jgi:hypoxia up-regulated 1